MNRLKKMGNCTSSTPKLKRVESNLSASINGLSRNKSDNNLSASTHGRLANSVIPVKPAQNEKLEDLNVVFK